MPSAPAPQDPIGAFLRRLYVLLAGLLGACIDDLVAEHAGLPPRHPMRPILLAQIATLRALRSGIEAQANAAPPAIRAPNRPSLIPHPRPHALPTGRPAPRRPAIAGRCTPKFPAPLTAPRAAHSHAYLIAIS